MILDWSKGLDLVQGQISDFARYVFENEVKGRRRLGERILPWVRQEDYEVSTGQVQFRSVAATILGEDSPLPRTPGATFAAQAYALLKLGRKTEVKESELKKLKEAFQLGRLSPENWATMAPFRFANALTVGFLDRAEWMRWQALSTGEIPLRDGVVVDYNVPATHQDILTTTARWDQSATADGLADLLEYADQVRASTGRKIEVFFMSSQALEYLLAQESTQSKLALAFGTIGQQVAAGMSGTTGFLPTNELVNRYLAQYGIIGGIRVYDADFMDDDPVGGSQPVLRRFLAENRIVGVAPTPVDGGMSAGVAGATATGYSALGPTAENNFEPGHYVWLERVMEPYTVAVKGTGWALPVITDPRTLFFAQVFDLP